MALIFLIFCLAMVAGYFQKRTWAISLIAAGLIFTLIVFWYHVSDILKINL